MGGAYEVVVGAGVLSLAGDDVTVLPHAWTEGGVTARTRFTGAHLLHLAVAGCVLDDAYREAGPLGLALDGVRVTADGGLDERWRSTGVLYAVDLALRHGTTVERVRSC